MTIMTINRIKEEHTCGRLSEFHVGSRFSQPQEPAKKK